MITYNKIFISQGQFNHKSQVNKDFQSMRLPRGWSSLENRPNNQKIVKFENIIRFHNTIISIEISKGSSTFQGSHI